MDGAADRARHRGDRVGVTAERRGQQAGLPRVSGHGAEHGERGGHRLLGGQAGADKRVDHLGRLGLRPPGDRPGAEERIGHRGLDRSRPAGRPADAGRDVRARHPVTALGTQRGGGDRCVGRRRDPLGPGGGRTAQAGADRRGHGGSPGQRHRRVVGDEAGLLHRVDQGPQVVRRDREADRGDAHRRPVGVAGTAGLFRRGARQHRVDRAAGGRAEQVERPARGHVALPGDQAVRQFARVHPAGQQQAAEQDRLLGVVGDGAGRHARGDRVPGRGGLEPGQQRPPAVDDLLPGQHLRGHAERVADRQAVQGAPGPVSFAARMDTEDMEDIP